MNSPEQLPDDAASLTGDGSIAEDFLAQIGSRIRALRQQRGLTMQQLADNASISRRLLTQIEHGQANPSLVAITRIARQLGTDFTSLLDGAADSPGPVEVFGSQDRVLVWTSAAGSTSHLLVATSPRRTADLWLWHLLPDDAYQGRADPSHSQELFYVMDGVLTIRTGDVEVDVPAGSASRLQSDRTYSYHNHGSDPVVFVRTVSLSAS
ncbi:helix-turn-helix domain-containing protein [Aeromicrobium sp. Root344]|uniref:helix-turn-helix domain-containing protein n=1 Tax=Aeromicrobium sp. Root344 TaxID=1736521 RepID=UPI0009E865A0|nr:XRE family transcriptional regulator [Aeromicrobium sp. Root344]